MKKTCEKHGEYSLTQIDWPFDASGKKWIGTCPVCNENKEKADKKREEDRLAEIKRNKRLNAGISQRNLFKNFNDYECEAGSGAEKAMLKFVAYAQAIAAGDHPGNMIVSGSVGTGKTLLASALIDSIIHKKTCRLIKLYDLMNEIKKTFSGESDKTEADIINEMSGFDLLIIDEVGTQTDSDWEKLQIFNVIDGRYQNMNPTVLISNLSAEEVQSVIGERSVDRLREEGAFVIPFNWPSKRGIKVVNNESA